MSHIIFTDRELMRSYRALVKLWRGSTGACNSYRLILFYAVECGLKVVWLKRKSKSVFDKDDIDNTGHDLARIIKDLNVSSDYFLPAQLQMKPVRTENVTKPRNGGISALHQVWRYGGVCVSPSDNDFENKLEEILCWISGELQ